MLRLILAATLLVSLGSPPSLASDKIGVVMLHAKTSLPSYGEMPTIRRALAQDFIVTLPEMAWSKSNYINKPLEESFDDIDISVSELRAEGATKIFVGGHSMGAAAALAYATSRKVDGVVMMAPGHRPEKISNQGVIKEAKQNIASGSPNKQVSIIDFNQGKRSELFLRSDVAVSWFDPEGLGNMQQSASRLLPGTPVLVIIGQRDGFRHSVKKLVVDRFPENESTRFIVVSGKHKETPRTGKEEIKSWIASVASGRKPAKEIALLDVSNGGIEAVTEWIVANKNDACGSDMDDLGDKVEDFVEDQIDAKKFTPDFQISKFVLRRFYKAHCQ